MTQICSFDKTGNQSTDTDLQHLEDRKSKVLTQAAASRRQEIKVMTQICSFYKTGNQSTDRSAASTRQEIKVLTQAAMFKRLQDHPMYDRMNQPRRGRLKRSNFFQHSRIFERRNSEPKPIPSAKTIPSWKRGKLL